MSHMEPLESRALLSATTLVADEATLHADITALPGDATSAYDTIKVDLTGHTITKADKAIATKWVNGIKGKYNALLKADTAGAALINKDVAKFDAATGAKQTAAGTKLENDAAKVLATITKDTNTLHTTDAAGVSAIGTAFASDAQVQTDVAIIQSNSNTHYATILADATLVFSTDTTAIATA